MNIFEEIAQTFHPKLKLSLKLAEKFEFQIKHNFLCKLLKNSELLQKSRNGY